MDRSGGTPIMNGVRLLLAASVAVAASTGVTTRSAEPAFPSRLDAYLTNVVRLSTGDRVRLHEGRPVTTLFERMVRMNAVPRERVYRKIPYRTALAISDSAVALRR